MKIGGIIDISTKDIPGKAAMVIFTVGCNFHCGFCHNKHLLQEGVGKIITLTDLMDAIRSNLLVSAVSITGGEPTLQKDIVGITKAIKDFGKYVSIDTNGSNPEVIRKLIYHVDRIALDLKAPLNEKKYKFITKININPNLVKDTINLINKYKEVEFEIRTTYVKNLLTPYDIHEIMNTLKELDFRGSYVLQQYQYSDGVGIQFQEEFEKPEHMDLLNILKRYKNSDFPFELYIRDDIIGYSKLEDIFNMKIEDF